MSSILPRQVKAVSPLTCPSPSQLLNPAPSPTLPLQMLTYFDTDLTFAHSAFRNTSRCLLRAPPLLHGLLCFTSAVILKVCGFAGALVSPFLARRFGRKHILIAGFAIITTCFLIIGAVNEKYPTNGTSGASQSAGAAMLAFVSIYEFVRHLHAISWSRRGPDPLLPPFSLSRTAFNDSQSAPPLSTGLLDV